MSSFKISQCTQTLLIPYSIICRGVKSDFLARPSVSQYARPRPLRLPSLKTYFSFDAHIQLLHNNSSFLATLPFAKDQWKALVVCSYLAWKLKIIDSWKSCIMADNPSSHLLRIWTSDLHTHYLQLHGANRHSEIAYFAFEVFLQ